ncbi:DUF6183 family protein [Streptomyces sp. NPDC020875]|uniref:DUF6183 family protein n=1 Tax=Streptomyces sp. NPDC020875 TaxID=3154898 RepID=UPI0033D4E859
MDDDARELERLAREEVEPRARQGDPAYGRELGARLAAGLAAAREQARTYERGLAGVVRTLALTPGRESVTQLLRLFVEHAPSAASGPGARLVASFLADAQRPEDLAELVFEHAGSDGLDDLRGCLFHELLLRGVDMESSWPLRSWPLVRPGWHALSWLPPELRLIETGAAFPGWTPSTYTGASWDGLGSEGRVDPPTPRTAGRLALPDLATVDVHEAITAAPATGEFGAYGAWVFALDAPVAPERVPTLIPALPMACVEDLGPTARFEIARSPLDEIWSLLFTTASFGGVYGGAAYGAFGRWAAWRSLAGLSGAPGDASVAEVERRAERCVWFRFECDAPWFHNEIHDYGIVALSPDRRGVAVLAATDTD